jgi:hypothetical protein
VPEHYGSNYYQTYKRMRYFAAGPQQINNTVQVTGSSAGVSCSYAGGCDFEVHSAGLASILKGNSTWEKIKVCDEECVYDPNTSTADITKCKLP